MACHNSGYMFLWCEYLTQIFQAPAHIQKILMESFAVKGSHDFVCVDTFVEKVNKFIKSRCPSHVRDMTARLHRICTRAQQFFVSTTSDMHSSNRSRLRHQRRVFVQTLDWMQRQDWFLKKGVMDESDLTPNVEWGNVLRAHAEESKVVSTHLMPQLEKYFNKYYKHNSPTYLQGNRR